MVVHHTGKLSLNTSIAHASARNQIDLLPVQDLGVQPGHISHEDTARQTKKPGQSDRRTSLVVKGIVQSLEGIVHEITGLGILVGHDTGIEIGLALAGIFVQLFARFVEFFFVIVIAIVIVVVIVVVIVLIVALATDTIGTDQIVRGQRVSGILFVRPRGGLDGTRRIRKGTQKDTTGRTVGTDIVLLVVGIVVAIIIVVVVVVVVVFAEGPAFHQFVHVHVLTVLVVVVVIVTVRHFGIGHALIVTIIVLIVSVIVVVVVVVLGGRIVVPVLVVITVLAGVLAIFHLSGAGVFVGIHLGFLVGFDKVTVEMGVECGEIRERALKNTKQRTTNNSNYSTSQKLLRTAY